MGTFELCMILNGPPGCGKDTLAEGLVARGLGFTKMQFKEALYRATAEHFRVPLREFIHRATDRDAKEIPWCKLRIWCEETLKYQHISPRWALIYTSEAVIKPKHGASYFGQAAAQRCAVDRVTRAVFSDGGFAEEIEPLADLYDQLVVVQLYRDGFTFNNDSRDYVTGPRTVELHLEDGEIDRAIDRLIEITGLEVPA